MSLLDALLRIKGGETMKKARVILTQDDYNKLCVDGRIFSAGHSLFSINTMTTTHLLCVYQDEYTKEITIERIEIIKE